MRSHESLKAALGRLKATGLPDQACLCPTCPCWTYVTRPRVCRLCVRGLHQGGNLRGNQGATGGNRVAPH